MTDVKPDNILVNYNGSGSRFGDVKLADCGDSTHMDSVVEEHIIGATIFRSPEAMLNLIWGPPTDIWSLGATARAPSHDTFLADDDRLDTLTIITRLTEKRTPFRMASSQEIAKEDREFISKLMRLDPRDRPSAKVLLQDAWLAE
ncbi:MAG: hypothetical protein Q9185_005678 [Variospora sp. 1 TL-2023]